jgi:D-arginine dehydrogenase
MESQPGYHTTGRSAALFTEAYGNASIRALTSGGRAFFTEPPEGFTDHPILTPRGAMFVGRSDQAAALDAAAEEAARSASTVRRIDGPEARAVVPVLRQDYVDGAVLEPDAMDIDVHALHHGFLRGLKAKGGSLETDADVIGLGRHGDSWEIETTAGTRRGSIVVNAAGAWCDGIARLAGAKPVGLVPKRRTAILFDPPPDIDIGGWPLCVDIDEEFYFKPDSDRLIGSPADETPMEPCDVQPEELDVAIAVDRIEKASTLEITSIVRRWAGLRSFVADKTPVVGFDPHVPGFFWVAGQGGYGIQTSPSMGRLAASLVARGAIPPHLEDLGITAAAVSPARFAEA